jgi:serine protease Do
MALKLDPNRDAGLGVGIHTRQGGVEVTDVVHGSRGERLGLQAGDLLKNINNHQVSNASELARVEAAPSLEVDVLRRGSDPIELRLGDPAQGPSPRHLGMNVGVEPDDAGLRVDSVYQGGVASRAGLKPGDLIHSIDGRSVRNVEELVDALFLARDTAEVSIQRSHVPLELTLDFRSSSRGLVNALGER